MAFLSAGNPRLFLLDFEYICFNWMVFHWNKKWDGLFSVSHRVFLLDTSFLAGGWGDQVHNNVFDKGKYANNDIEDDTEDIDDDTSK
jgi:hypothetical protein